MRVSLNSVLPTSERGPLSLQEAHFSTDVTLDLALSVSTVKLSDSTALSVLYYFTMRTYSVAGNAVGI